MSTYVQHDIHRVINPVQPCVVLCTWVCAATPRALTSVLHSCALYVAVAVEAVVRTQSLPCGVFKSQLAQVLQGVLEALVKFMLNLEHMAVLFALLNTKKAGQNVSWRKKQYGQVVRLLKKQLTDYEYFVKQLDQVISKMWASLPAIQQMGSACKQDLHQGSAIQCLEVMHLYVDSKADETRENLAECRAGTSQDISDTDAEAAAEAEAEALAAADMTVDGDSADVEDEDNGQSQVGEEDVVAARRPNSAQTARTVGPSGRHCL